MSQGVEPAKRLDISYSDYAFGLKSCVVGSEKLRSELERDLQILWTPEETLTALSVRTAFDSYLSALRLPLGSHVLMTAVTIPDMVLIVEAHGLVPIAIDIDFDGLAPQLDCLIRAKCDRTKALVISHLFGTVIDMAPWIRWGRENGVLIIEDCAEAYCGPVYRGCDDSDISMFSFGSIKTETALGGALFRIKDSTVRSNVRDILNHYPVQSISVFSKRLIKYMAFSVILNKPRLYQGFVKGASTVGSNHTDFLLKNSRGFIGQDLFQAIRLQPPVPLLMLLKRRISNFSESRLEKRRSNCELVVSLINAKIPGLKVSTHYYWLCPVCVENPNQAQKKLLAAGFDATTATTSLVCIDTVVTEKDDTYQKAFKSDATAKFMDNILYLPVDADTPEVAIRAMANCLNTSKL